MSPLHPQPQFPSEAKQAFGLRSRFSPVSSGRGVPIHPPRFAGSAAAPLHWVLEGAPACQLGAGYGGAGGRIVLGKPALLQCICPQCFSQDHAQKKVSRCPNKRSSLFSIKWRPAPADV